jgi:hypothetical protein
VAPSGLGTVVGIDPASNRVVGHAVPLGTPAAIAAGPTGLWVVDFSHAELVHLVLASGPN